MTRPQWMATVSPSIEQAGVLRDMQVQIAELQNALANLGTIPRTVWIPDYTYAGNNRTPQASAGFWGRRGDLAMVTWQMTSQAISDSGGELRITNLPIIPINAAAIGTYNVARVVNVMMQAIVDGGAGNILIRDTAGANPAVGSGVNIIGSAWYFV